MKKILFFVFATLCIASCRDHKPVVEPPIEPEVKFTYEYLSAGTGSWYEEAENEEFSSTTSIAM